MSTQGNRVLELFFREMMLAVECGVNENKGRQKIRGFCNNWGGSGNSRQRKNLTGSLACLSG